jgi:hypothetical protein
MVTINQTVVLFLVLASSPFLSRAQAKFIAPIEQSGFTHATRYDTLQTFLKHISSSPGVRVEPMATTRLGRTVSVTMISGSNQFGSDTTKLRVLLFAQQHGDEPAGKEALTLLLASLASGHHTAWKSSMDILIVPQMNPDGAELRQRRTSDTIDLNRNHVLLTSPETRGLHDLFDLWKPEVTLDMHEYSSSKAWRDSGLVKTADVQLGMLTHPNTPEGIRHMQHQDIYPFIAAEMAHRGYRFQEYIVGSPDSRIRNSTTEINDGRQSFGILNTMSFIQEGRKWYGLDDTLKRRAESHLASVEALLEYCSRHAAEIRWMVAAERLNLSRAGGTRAVLRMEHIPGKGQSSIPVFNLRTKRDTLWTVVPYHSVVESRLSAVIPPAYVVRKQFWPAIELLRRHHVVMEEVSKERSVRAEVCTVDSVGAEDIEETMMPKPLVKWKRTTIVVHPGDVMIRTNQLRSLLVTIVLEPESVWGLMGYPSLDALLKKPGLFPISRIEP